MDYSVDTPFENYQEILQAVRTNKAKLSFRRSGAYGIACNINPFYAILNLLIPIFSIVGMFAICLIFHVSKWTLLFGIVVFFIHTVTPHVKGVLWTIAIALVLLPLFVLTNHLWMIAIGVGIICMILGYDVWWGIITGVVHAALMESEQLFEMAWETRTVALKTGETFGVIHLCGYGNKNSK